MIFIDSNVPMYLVGAPHPNKDRAVAVLTQLAREGERFVTDVEVYQEILRRYTAIQRLDAINAAFESLGAIVDDTLSFDMSEIRAARDLIASVDGISARDALHVAVMRKSEISRIFSFDRGFDTCPGIDRMEYLSYRAYSGYARIRPYPGHTLTSCAATDWLTSIPQSRKPFTSRVATDAPRDRATAEIWQSA